MVKSLPAMQETQIQSLVGKIPRRRKWQTTPVFLPREFHRERNLVGYSPGNSRKKTQRLLLSHLSIKHVSLLFPYILFSMNFDFPTCLLHFSHEAQLYPRSTSFHYFYFVWKCLYFTSVLENNLFGYIILS